LYILVQSQKNKKSFPTIKMGDIEAAVKALKAGVDVLKVMSLLFQYNTVFVLLHLPVYVHLC